MEKTTSGAAHTTSQRQAPQPQRGGLIARGFCRDWAQWCQGRPPGGRWGGVLVGTHCLRRSRDCSLQKLRGEDGTVLLAPPKRKVLVTESCPERKPPWKKGNVKVYPAPNQANTNYRGIQETTDMGQNLLWCMDCGFSKDMQGLAQGCTAMSGGVERAWISLVLKPTICPLVLAAAQKLCHKLNLIYNRYVAWFYLTCNDDLTKCMMLFISILQTEELRLREANTQGRIGILIFQC